MTDEHLDATEQPGDDAPEGGNDLERYRQSGIEIKERKVNRWLIAVYVALTVWGIYYLIFIWGGLGPGLGLR